MTGITNLVPGGPWLVERLSSRTSVGVTAPTARRCAWSLGSLPMRRATFPFRCRAARSLIVCQLERCFAGSVRSTGVLAILAMCCAAHAEAQTRATLSTEQVEKAMGRAGGITFKTKVSQLKQGVVEVETTDGTLQFQSDLQPDGRFIELPASVTVQARNDFPAVVTKIEVETNSQWHSLPASEKARFPELSLAQQKLKTAANFSLASLNPTAFRQAKLQAENVESEIVDAYINAPMSREDGRALVEAYKENAILQQRTFRKDYNERYPPAAYQRIYANTRSSLALQLKGAELPQCSGVLIGPSVALTNRHCVSEYQADELEAVFDYESDLDGNVSPRRVFPVKGIEFRDSAEFLDFAILQLGASNGAQAGAVYPVQCMSLAPVRRGEAIYVVGYPLGQPRAVHDNTHVYFPFTVDEKAHAELEIQVRAEFKAGAEEDQSYRDGKLREFVDAYRRRTESSGDVIYEYFSARFGDQPTIGANSDTYAGNSGSPAFHRRTHALVGLLFDGHDQDDTAPWSPGWRTHEAILPITEVLNAIEQQKPGWKDSNGLCVTQ